MSLELSHLTGSLYKQVLANFAKIYIMNDIQYYQPEAEEPLQDEDDSECLKESGIIEESTRTTGNTNWCLSELWLILAQVISEHLTTFKAIMAALQ